MAIIDRITVFSPFRSSLSAREEVHWKKEYWKKAFTAIGTCSPRARHGFLIAANVTWRDLEKGIKPDAFTMEKPN